MNPESLQSVQQQSHSARVGRVSGSLQVLAFLAPRPVQGPRLVCKTPEVQFLFDFFNLQEECVVREMQYLSPLGDRVVMSE